MARRHNNQPPADPRPPPSTTRASPQKAPTKSATLPLSDPATTALSPSTVSEEVTVVLIRHLRHAATLLPIAKGAEFAREWLLAFEQACGDVAGIGDVVGGSMALFTPLYTGGHLAAMPSTVSASAAAKLLAVVTPLVEQISRRRYALRVSALLDPQSAIFRKLARRAPATCRLASAVPPSPTSKTRNTGGSNENAVTRRSRTTGLAAQLAEAKAEIERLRAEVAELRQVGSRRRSTS